MREYYTNGYDKKSFLMDYVVLIGVIFCLGGIERYFNHDTKKDTSLRQHINAESNLVEKVNGGKN